MRVFHSCSCGVGSCYFPAEALFVPVPVPVPVPALTLAAAAFSAAGSLPTSGAANTLPISSRMTSRPWYLARPVTQSSPPSCIMAGAASISLFGSFSTSQAESTIQPAQRRFHNHARQPSPVFHHQNAVAPVQSARRLPKPLPQIHHRHNLPAQINDPFQIIGRVRHRGDLWHALVLMQRRDGHAVGRTAHAKAHNVCFLAHE